MYILTGLTIILSLAMANAGEIDFTKLDKSAAKFDGKPPTNEEWKKWEDSLGFTLPKDYKAFINRYPNAIINSKFGFIQPRVNKVSKGKNNWGMFKTTFPKWPDENGYFRILDPIRESLTVAYRIKNGKIEGGRIYIIDLEIDEVNVYKGGFISFMEEMMLDSYDRQSTKGYLSFLMSYCPIDDDSKPIREPKSATS